MIGALLAVAVSAATPGGFRAPLGVASPMVSSRQVVIPPTDAPWLSQTTLRAQALFGGPWAVAAELPMLRSWQPGWSDTGLGQLRLGVRRFSGKAEAPVAVVAELAFPAAPRAWRVSSWGSSARETLPGVEAVAGVELGVHPRAPSTLRAVVGVREGPFLGQQLAGPHVVADLAVAQVLPLVGPLSLVAEGEILRDLTPLSGRGLLRIDADTSRARWSIDAGVQVPVLAVVDRVGGPQAIGQVRWIPSGG